jgi:Trypsin
MAFLISLIVAQGAAAQTRSADSPSPSNPATVSSPAATKGGMLLDPKRKPAAPRGIPPFNAGIFKQAPAMVFADPDQRKKWEELLKSGVQLPSTPGNNNWMVRANPVNDQTRGRGQQGIFIVGGDRLQEAAARFLSALPITADTPAPEAPSGIVVAITYSERGSQSTSLCTGTVLDATHILTAGHCGCSEPTSYRITIAMRSILKRALIFWQVRRS